MMKTSILLCLAAASDAFHVIPSSNSRRTRVLLREDRLDSVVSGDVDDCVAAPESDDLHASLRARQRDIEEGIGKRFICRTQRGFLNVHKEPGDPYETNNIVGQLSEGDIVTSTSPQRGAWVKHDGGGWSISIDGGFTWLEPLDE